MSRNSEDVLWGGLYARHNSPHPAAGIKPAPQFLVHATPTRLPQLYAFITVLLLLLTGPIRAAPLQKDLGEGLAYFRVHELPQDLPAASVKPGAIVLDLRFATAHEDAGTALDAWLSFRATAPTPVFVLLDAQTAEHFASVLAAHQSNPGFLTLGESTEEFTPDVEIDASPDEEKKAYDALEKGASVSSLTTENADKPRNDEAALMHARANPAEEPSDSDLADVEQPRIDKTKPALPVPEPVIDRTLQRAIHVHRGLLALKRLQAPKA
jgi:hypothetical protein